MAGRSAASYQRELQQLRALVARMQWVLPMSNTSESCAGCGEMKHHGCSPDCPAARVTGDRGGGE